MKGNADTLRPMDFEEFVGQEALKERLLVHIDAAIADRRPMPHTLILGPPGMGKTCLAHLIAAELHEPILCHEMPIDEKTLVRAVRQHHGVLFLDEMHRASRKEQERLLPLLERGYVETKTGQRFEAKWLTIIGATTEKGDIIEPLRDRFTVQPDIDDYTDEEMGRIVQGMALKAGLIIEDTAAQQLGRATAGTPRRALTFVRAARDLLVARGKEAGVLDVLRFCRTDPDGLTVSHNRFLHTLDTLGGRGGIERLATALRIDKAETTTVERLLLDKGFVSYCAGGRELTQAGYDRMRQRPLEPTPRPT